MNVPTFVYTNCAGQISTTCVDHIFANAKEMCSEVLSILIGFSDHNVVATVRKVKVPKVGSKVVFQKDLLNLFVRMTCLLTYCLQKVGIGCII